MKFKLGSLRRLVREVLLRETDDRMMGDDAANGDADLGFPEELAAHLQPGGDRPDLGDPNDDDYEDESYLDEELRRFFLQEDDQSASAEGGAVPVPGESTEDGATPEPGVAPETMGFYTPFDMVKDHTGTDNPNSTWYRSPGQPVGDNDPFRSSDPYAQLGFHPPADSAVPSPGGEAGGDAGGAEDSSGAEDVDVDTGGSDVPSDDGTEEEKPKESK